MQKKLIFSLLIGLLLGGLRADDAAPRPLDELKNSMIAVKSITNLLSQGQPLSASFEPRYIHSIAWSPDGKYLLIDRRNVTLGHCLERIPFPVSDGKVENLTPKRDGNHRLNYSNPAWTVDGKGIVFVAQNRENPTSTREAQPPYGLASNLAYMAVGGKSLTLLTNARSNYSLQKGMVSPRFSPDGRKLLRTKCEQARGGSSLWGDRELAIGNFSVDGDGIPKLTKVKTFTPAKSSNAYYESYGFSPDGTKILYCSNLEIGQQWVTADIVVQDYDAQENALRNEPVVLTRSPDSWDRYASWSPGGRKIIWSSSAGFMISYMGVAGAQWQQEMRSELWLMNSNGSDSMRLTSFNYKNSPYYLGGPCYVGMSAWHPGGRHIAVLVHKAYKLTDVTTALLLIELEDGTPVPPPAK